MGIDVADRTEQIKEYYFAGKLSEINKRIIAGEDIINFGIGSPDLSPPVKVINDLNKYSILPQANGYQPYRGIAELRTAISDWYGRYFKVDLDPDHEILPLIGSKEGIVHISMAYLNRGDAVLVPDPGYPAYAAAAKLCGARCIYYELTDENDWKPDTGKLENLDLCGVKLMWVNYPNMPAGVSADIELFSHLADFARRHNILLVNDNPYSFILNNNPVSILSSDSDMEHVLELNSLSKSHNMAGWRVGMVLGHRDHINNILKIKSNIDSGMYFPVQKAAVTALGIDREWYHMLNTIYGTRQKMVYELLRILGCSVKKGQTGMFVWSKIPEGFSDSYAFSDFCLDNYRVFITPGLVFGSNGQSYVRTSLCIDETRIRVAIERVKNNII